MATHDYIISNASGAAVRADLNNALAAIVSNNSNATSPATTYAYQWWADTTTGQLKLRNSANSAWITIFELDGTMLMEDGTVSAPGLAFASDLNTGFFKSDSDKINFATGGAERLEIGGSEIVFNDPSNDVDFRVESNGNSHMLFVDAGNDRVGIGTSSPLSGANLTVAGNALAVTGQNTAHSANSIRIGEEGSGAAEIRCYGPDASTNASLTLRMSRSDGSNSQDVLIDSSGRVGIGTSSPLSELHVEKATQAHITVKTASSNMAKFGSKGNDVYIGGTSGSANVIFKSNITSVDHPADSGTERMRIESGGASIFSGTVAPKTDNTHNVGGASLRWSAIYAVNGTIQTSDQREKTNILDSSLGVDFIKSLRPVSYKWINGGQVESSVNEEGKLEYTSHAGQRTHWGFIAQEVKQSVDDAGVDFGGWVLTDKDDSDSQQALRYDQFIAPLTKALQEAITKIETLEAKVAALEAG